MYIYVFMYEFTVDACSSSSSDSSSVGHVLLFIVSLVTPSSMHIGRKNESWFMRLLLSQGRVDNSMPWRRFSFECSLIPCHRIIAQNPCSLPMLLSHGWNKV
jgi:hypothetical protein